MKTKPTSRATAAGERRDRHPVAPARRAVRPRGGVREAVDQQRQAGRAGHHAGDVEAAPQPAAAHQRHRGQRGDDEADRRVDEEDPAPRHVGGQDPAEQQADGAAGAGHARPDAERPVARRAHRERRGDQSEGRRGCERGPGALHGARRQQPPARGGEAADQRGQGEQQDAGHEDAPAAVDVAQPAAEQQQAAEGERVGGDDPLEPGPAEAEGLLDVRQRHVHDRRVEDDHELGRGDHDERQAQAARDVGRAVSRGCV